MKKFKFILASIVTVVVIIFMVIGIKTVIKTLIKNNSKSTNSMITARLEDASELTTKKMFYSGLIKYKDDGSFLNKENFSMVYNATVRAGIDFSKVDVNVSKDKVIIKIPKPKIQSIDIDSDSLEFYDEKYAPFNIDQRDDVTDAISQAETKVAESEQINILLEEADESSKSIIQKLIENEIGDRKLVIETIE